ncbi:MAG: hypothetical protein ACXADH_16090, partial [Candidatus Kariarchaeaceae archaeon]
RVTSTDTGGAGLAYASFPDIGLGFSVGGTDVNHVGGLWEFSYLINNPAVANYNGSVYISILDFVGNNQTASFDLYHDNTPPQSVLLDSIVESSEFLFYHAGSEIFYYSNDQSMTESFTVRVTATDLESGRQKANASEFGDSISTSSYGGNGYELSFTINPAETAPTFTVYIWDNVDNAETFNLVTQVDNTPPQDLNIISILESSDFLYYDGSDLYYSNDQSMSATFKTRISGIDSGAGRKNVTGEDEFGDTGVGNTTYTTYYQLQYNIVQNDDTSDGFLTIWLYDNVGNRNSLDLTCIEDNLEPSLAISTVIESSYYLYFDPGNTILYYSNDQTMNEPFTIRVTGSDSGAGRLNATGESDFGETNVGDTIYTSYYELSYSISMSEIASSNYVVVYMYDRVGNYNSLNLDCTLDNDAPNIVTLNSLVGADASNFLYYDGSELYYSNDQPMSEDIQLHVNVVELLSGVQNVTGSLDFEETPSTTTNASGLFVLQYTISQSEITNGSDGNIQVFVWDRVGNVNSGLTVTATLDNDAPTNITITDILDEENSYYLYYSGAILYYSNENDFSQNEVFRVQITAQDGSGSGLLRVDGSTDFADSPSDTSYLPQNYYLVNYTVGYSEEASGDQIAFSVFDRVSNVDSVTLNLVKDNEEPTGISIQSLVETSAHLYYDSSGKKLYFSNDQVMSDQFDISLLAQDYPGGAGLLNVTGTLAFGEQSSDLTYVGEY